jgi:transcriptional regulator with GAF, ATPase, and Fis domain
VLFSTSGHLAFGPLKDLLLNMAEARDSEALLHLVLQRLSDGSADVALACAWLIARDEACDACERAESSPHEECLHLAAHAGSSPVDARVEDALRRMPTSAFDIGRALSSREAVTIDVASFDMPPLTSDWARAHAVGSFWGHRLANRDRMLGVLGVFLRTTISTEDDDALRLVASQLAAGIANQRTMDELQRLQQRIDADGPTARLRAIKAVVSEADLRRFERENILAALEATRGRVYGRGGAAELLGLKPTTLASRLKKLGISVRS